MTTTAPTVTAIRAALATMIDSDLSVAATNLLPTLGYRSERTLPGQSGDPADFIRQFPAANPGTASEQALLEAAQSVHVVFQYTASEIQAQTQRALFDAAGFDTGNARSFLFAAVQLAGDAYPRGRYAAFTRELNRHIQLPMVVLFRTAAGRVTLAFVHRRPNKRDPERDVLGSVSLIREIDAADPHRAHLDILAELSLDARLKWLNDHGKPHNFDGLLDAWLDALDTEALNRRFYRELFDWFERAVADARFPKDEAVTLPAEEHVIRLITRLLFVWFIKEKGLVADDLFVENRVRQLLQDYDPDAGDSYYRAVLQNLFFATLNTEIAERGFSAERESTHRVFSRYRYRKEMADPDDLLALFAKTPFINGGLFDCLDSEDATGQGGYRIDCFSDVHYGKLSIPNRLFFGQDANGANPGLITLFNRYKFTVEENTPAEREVALDPELLGKVFENLLAAFNPETRENARKQTGSYYTPRAVVDYMVDEALAATLAQKTEPAPISSSSTPSSSSRPSSSSTPSSSFLRKQESMLSRLRHLLDYDVADAPSLFSDPERAAIVRAIAGVKVLDPAVGSGAFPMGVLHKLTLALRRLDPHNELWESLQKELAGQRAASAFDTADQSERDAELREISATFQRYRDSDFGRKLYLIQNGIYGVDIQPIATQIAKLRFFISLAIDQEPALAAPDDPDAPPDTDANAAADNYGIKPLPNLETRFVAANSLLGIGQPAQPALTQANNIAELHGQIRANRERHFHATSRRRKQQYRQRDRDLRRELAAALRESGFAADSARQIADWDPYDQNASANWFDAEYMFGVPDGFDVVIGNPPYVQLQKDGGRLGRLYKDAGYATYVRTGDVYQLFCEQGCNLLTPDAGLLAYITSNSWLRAEYGRPLRRYLAGRHTPLQLLEMGKDVFENTIVDTSILLLRQGRPNGHAAAGLTVPAVDLDRLDGGEEFPPDAARWGLTRPDGDAPWSILSAAEQSVMDKMAAIGTPLQDWDVSTYRGITTGLNRAFVIDEETRAALVAADAKSDDIIKPVLRGRDIQRYQARWAGLYVIATLPALQLNIDDYPAVKNHLLNFGKDRLEQSGKALQGGGKSRKKTQHEWFEIQDATSYHSEFRKEKLFWMDLTDSGRFAYDADETFCVNTVFMMTGPALKYLCAVLNSRLITWYMSNTALNSGMGVTRWIGHTVEQIPIPKVSAAKQRPLVRLVDRILSAKTAAGVAAPNAADTRELEEEIDRLVYALYGLTDAEVAAVAGR